MHGSNTGGPTTAAPVLMQVPTGGTTYNFPIADPDGHSATCSLVSDGVNVPTPPSGLSVSSACVMTFNPSGYSSGDKFAYQVELTETGTTSTASTIFDGMIQLVSGNVPSCSGGGNYDIEAGQLFTETFVGTDADGGTLSASLINGPSGATLSPSSGSEPLTTTFSWTPTTSDLGAYASVITYTDSSGFEGSCSLGLSVLLLPSADAGGPYSTTEGGSISMDGSGSTPGDASDPSSAITLYEWDCEGDGTYEYSSTSSTGDTCSYAQDGTYTLGLRVTDGYGLEGTGTATVTVTNISPVISTASGDTSGVEGDWLSWSASATDVGVNDTLTYTWDFGDGNSDTGSSVSYSYVDDATFTVTLVVTDGDGGSDTTTITVAVSNATPTIDSFSGDSTGNEGDTLSYSASASDAGLADVLTYTWDFGDGGSGTGSSVNHVFDNEGTYTVTLVVDDGDGASDTQTMTVTISNVAPSIDSLTGTVSGNEGDTFTFLASASDPGSGDPISYVWDFGDGGTGSGTYVMNQYTNEGTYTLTLTVSDGTDSTSSTLTVLVANVAPTFNNSADTTANIGELYSYTPSVSDPGADTMTYSLVGGYPSTMTIDSSTGYVSWTPSYTDWLTGTFTFNIVVNDGTESTVQTVTVVVSFIDADGDGMADAWEIDNGLDSTDGTDGSLDSDGDGLTNLEEFNSGQDPNVFDGPSAVTLVFPTFDDGETDQFSPTIIWDNATDPQGDVLIYNVELYAEESMITLVTSSYGVDEESGSTSSWQVDVTLVENTEYWVQVQAEDPYVAGDWSTLTPLWVNTVNEAPGETTLVYPIAEEVADSLTPEMLWTHIGDIDRDVVSYDVEIYEYGTSNLVASTMGVEADESDINAAWVVDVSLVEDAWYDWSVRPVDEHGLVSAWTDLESFVVSETNSAPEGVVFIDPQDGDHIETVSPTLEATEGTDAEGFEISYLFEIDEDSSFSTGAYISGVVAESGTGSVMWDLAADGIELTEHIWVYARVRGVDSEGVGSSPDTISFFVRGENDPPDVPELISPVDEESTRDIYPVFEAGVVSDPEGDDVTCDFVVATDPDLTDVVASIEGISWESGASITWTPEEPLSGDIYWSSRSVDEFGATSDWAVPHLLIIYDGNYSGGCSCSTSESNRTNPIWIVLLGGVALLRRRK